MEEEFHSKPEIESVPTSVVKEFVRKWLREAGKDETVEVVWAEKLNDLLEEENFIFEIGLDEGISVYFSKEGKFLHSFIDNDYDRNQILTMATEEIPSPLVEAIEQDLPSSRILSVEKEISLESDREDGFVFYTIVEREEQELRILLGSNFDIYHTRLHEKEEFSEWMPLIYPDSIDEKMQEVFGEAFFMVEERYDENGERQLVASVDEYMELVFDEVGNFLNENDLWGDRIANLDPGLTFDPERSRWGSDGLFVMDHESGYFRTDSVHGSNVFVVVLPVEKNFADDSEKQDEFESEPESSPYRVFFMNNPPSENNVKVSDLELGETVLSAGTDFSLTFTYQMEAPRYIVVSGSEVSAFKHRKMEWDEPGSFSIKAKTVNPVASGQNQPDVISSTFGLLVEMAGNRDYGGAIFETNVVGLDFDVPKFSEPWEPVASFFLDGTPSVQTVVRSIIPRHILRNRFDLTDPREVRAGIVDLSGNVSFVDDADGEQVSGFAGSDFERLMIRGYESMDGQITKYADSSFMEDDRYLLKDEEFGISPELGFPTHDTELTEKESGHLIDSQFLDPPIVDPSFEDGALPDGAFPVPEYTDTQYEQILSDLEVARQQLQLDGFPVDQEFGLYEDFVQLDLNVTSEDEIIDDIIPFEAEEEIVISDPKLGAEDQDFSMDQETIEEWLEEQDRAFTDAEQVFPDQAVTMQAEFIDSGLEEIDSEVVDVMVASSIRRSSYFEDVDPENQEGEGVSYPEISKFDFNGDGYGDSIIVVSFASDIFPGEVQIGSPYVDPYASLDDSTFGYVKGSVVDIEEQAIEEYDVWFFSVPEEGSDLYDGEPVYFEFEPMEGQSYLARMPEGFYHAEAYGFNPETDSWYEPRLAVDENGKPLVLEVVTGEELSLDFFLKKEYSPSDLFLEVQGLVSLPGDEDEVEDLYLDFFPIDENGQDLTDHAVHFIRVEDGGRISNEAPVGRYRVELFSPSNSLEFSDSPVELIIEEGKDEILDLGIFEINKKALTKVTGRISDPEGNGIWADVVFVNPLDPDEEFFPVWEEVMDSQEYEDGSFAVNISAGEYWVRAERFDGLYQPTYFDSDGDGNPDVVSLGTEPLELNISLLPYPSATVTIKVVDGRTGDAVPHVWFSFHGEDEELGSVVYPNLSEIDYESGEFDGNYTLNVPVGTYLVQAESEGYEPVMGILDESGDLIWKTVGFEEGAVLDLEEEQILHLGEVFMTTFEISEAERLGYDWLEMDDDVILNNLRGRVLTNNGIEVPKATIIAYSEDGLVELDDAESRVDGSFELRNLPDGNWFVFAVPPYDSEAYHGFRESMHEFVSLPDDLESNLDLILQGSNVSGRILFPKKTKKSEKAKLRPLTEAFVWAFRDENKNGVPDWEESEVDDSLLSFSEETSEIFYDSADGETDQDGFFSFHLENPGAYSLMIEMPGELSSVAIDPIFFSIKNPEVELKLANAIRIDWKNEIKATGFEIERKGSKDSSYKSILSNAYSSETSGQKTGPDSKSFIDETVRSGEEYSYRVVADAKNGRVELDDSKVRVSMPFIYLAPSEKTISGRVMNDSDEVVAGVEVEAWSEEGMGWTTTLTEEDGSYELNAGPGKWEVMVYPAIDTKVDWTYDQSPKRINFPQDNLRQNKEVNFLVTKMGNGGIIGSLAVPEGMSAEDLMQNVFIEAYDSEGIGNWSYPDAEGGFEIPLPEGDYEFSIWVDPQMDGFGSPKPEIVSVEKSKVDMGEITLVSRDQRIEGVVATTSGKPLPNIEVWAWSEEGGYLHDFTNLKGEYNLVVSPGRWEIGYGLPETEEGDPPPYLEEGTRSVRVKPGDDAKVLNFSPKEANSKIRGSVYGPTGSVITGLDAWVYARESTLQEQDDDLQKILAEVALSKKGTFSFPSMPGQYLIGLWLSPGTKYSSPEEIHIELVEENGGIEMLNGSGDVLEEVRFDLVLNDAKVSGSLLLNGSAVAGLAGEVFAVQADGEGWQEGSIEEDGSYSLTLSSGDWNLDYYIESDELERDLRKYPSESIGITLENGVAAKQDFVLSLASAKISGSVFKFVDSIKQATSSKVYVWAHREASDSFDAFWNEVETNESGTFSIPVLPGGKYEIGAVLSSDLREQGYLDPQVLEVVISNSNITDLEMILEKPNPDNFISGTLMNVSGQALADALVYAWTDEDREIQTTTDINGEFTLSATSGAVWHIGGEYSTFNEDGAETFLESKVAIDADLSKQDSVHDLIILVEEPDFVIPDGSSESFDPGQDFVKKLPDGAELIIPAGAINVPSTVSSMRIVITPTARGLVNSASDKPADYGYSVELFDQLGKKIEGVFREDVIMKIPVDVQAFKENGMDVDEVDAMYYSTVKDAWVRAKTSTWDPVSQILSLTTDHFTTFAAVSNPNFSDLSEGMAKVDASQYGSWYESDWFGFYLDAGDDWIYHESLGWLFVKAESDGNFWIFDASLGWLWTGKNFQDEEGYLMMYSTENANWLYVSPKIGDTAYYDYSLKSWQLLE